MDTFSTAFIGRSRQVRLGEVVAPPGGDEMMSKCLKEKVLAEI